MKYYVFLCMLIAFPVVLVTASCEMSEGLTEQDPASLPLEERIEVSHDERGTLYEINSLRVLPIDDIFVSLLNNGGYHVWFDDATHYKAYDPATGRVGHMTLIPCSIPDDDSRVAMIKYFRCDDDYAVTAAEYFRDEDYQIPHPINELAALDLIGGDMEPALKLELIERSDMSARFWQCAVKRFLAGCSGCATVCWLSGPGWGICTAKCCAGSAVVALISCAATIFLGW